MDYQFYISRYIYKRDHQLDWSKVDHTEHCDVAVCGLRLDWERYPHRLLSEISRLSDRAIIVATNGAEHTPGSLRSLCEQYWNSVVIETWDRYVIALCR